MVMECVSDGVSGGVIVTDCVGDSERDADREAVGEALSDNEDVGEAVFCDSDSDDDSDTELLREELWDADGLEETVSPVFVSEELAVAVGANVAVSEAVSADLEMVVESDLDALEVAPEAEAVDDGVSVAETERLALLDLEYVKLLEEESVGAVPVLLAESVGVGVGAVVMVAVAVALGEEVPLRDVVGLCVAPVLLGVNVFLVSESVAPVLVGVLKEAEDVSPVTVAERVGDGVTVGLVVADSDKLLDCD